MDGPATKSATVVSPSLLPQETNSASTVRVATEVSRAARITQLRVESVSARPPEPASASDYIGVDAAALERAVSWPAARVSEAMSRPVLTIDATESLWDAWQLLSISGLRHLAVVTDDKCVGIISDRNILSDVPVSQEHMCARSVGEVVSPATNRSVGESDQLAQVARIMARHSLEAVPVVGPSRNLVGIVTGSDLVRWWADDGA